MRLTAPIVGGAAIALALVAVGYFGPTSETSLGLDEPAAPAPAMRAEDGSVSPRAATALAEPVPSSVAPAATPESSLLERSPLPGEAPATPMTQLLEDRELNVIVGRTAGSESAVPPELAEGEREFAAEPIDSAWAPGAEAKLLATFAERPGLKLIDLHVECRSTMCRLQMTQPPADPGQGLLFNVLRDEVGMTPRWMMAVVDGFPTDQAPRPLPMRSIAYLWREGFAPDRGAQQ